MSDYQDLIGIPFAYGGRGTVAYSSAGELVVASSLGHGPMVYDCYGVLMEMWRRRRGFELPDYRSPATLRSIAKLVHKQMSLWRPVAPGEGVVTVPCLQLDGSTRNFGLAPEFALLFRIEGFGAHLGFMVDKYQFIHTWEESHGVLCEPIMNWLPRLAGVYDYAG